jgi:hypothetical protein
VCEDESGNVGTAATTVTRIPPDVTPPVVTVISPVNGSTTTESTAVLTYLSEPGATCTPPSGTTVRLSPGVNTFEVTCVDASGNVSVASVTVTSNPTVDPLPVCARDVAITNVAARRG